MWLFKAFFINFILLLGPGDLASVQGQGGCPTPGCKGIGHIKGAKYAGHHRYVINHLKLTGLYLIIFCFLGLYYVSFF